MLPTADSGTALYCKYNNPKLKTDNAAPCCLCYACCAMLCCRLVVPEGYVAVGSTADGGAAPSPHRLALHIYRRPGRESVLQVGWHFFEGPRGGVACRGCCVVSRRDQSCPSHYQCYTRNGTCTDPLVEPHRSTAFCSPRFVRAVTAFAKSTQLVTDQHVFALPVSQGITSALAAAASMPAPPADAAAAADVPGKAAAGAAAPAADAHNTPLLVLYGSNMGECWECLISKNSKLHCSPQVCRLGTSISFVCVGARLLASCQLYPCTFPVWSPLWSDWAGISRQAPPKPAHTHRAPCCFIGTCEELAGTVASQATAAGFKVKVANLDSCVRAAKGGADVLPKNGAVVIVSSTYNGTPPDNASAFAKWLDGQKDGKHTAEL